MDDLDAFERICCRCGRVCNIHEAPRAVDVNYSYQHAECYLDAERDAKKGGARG